MVIGLIVFNAIWVAMDADYSDDMNEGGPIPAVIIDSIDLAICLVFVVELSIRVMATYPDIGSFIRTEQDGFVFFNILDLIITSLMVLEDVILANAVPGIQEEITFFLIVRIFRLLRIVKLFVMVPALSFLATALGCALRSVTATVLILLTMMYVYGVVFAEWQSENSWTDNDYLTSHFKGVFPSMLSMFDLAVYDNAITQVRNISSESLAMALLAISFIILGGFLILNVLIGVIADVVAQESDLDEARKLIEDIDEIFTRIDTDGDNKITETEFIQSGKPLLLKLEISDYVVDGVLSIIRAQDASQMESKSMIVTERFLTREEFILFMSKMLAPPSSEDLLLINKKIAKIKHIIDTI
jgi:voltage-gated sodium channel